MQTYWDLSDKQRSELTDEQFAAFLAVERMQKGAIKPPEPEYVDETQPTVPTVKVFRLGHEESRYSTSGGMLFASAEDAEKAAALVAGVTGYDYHAGSNFIVPAGKFTIEPIDLPSRETMTSISAAQKT